MVHTYPPRRAALGQKSHEVTVAAGNSFITRLGASERAHTRTPLFTSPAGCPVDFSFLSSPVPQRFIIHADSFSWTDH